MAHVFTHFALRLTIYVAEAPAGCAAPGECRWTPVDTLHREALPSLMRKAAAHAGIDARRRK